MIVICAGTTGYNATIDLRYLWMRQKRFQGSHFANDEQCYAMNELALAGKLNPCMSRAFTYDEMPLSHQLMHDNKHPHGNMAVLVGAPVSASARRGRAGRGGRAKLPADDLHDPKLRHPYPVSEPLPGFAAVTGEPVIHDDGSMRERMHPGIISCRRGETIGQASKTMIDNDIRASGDRRRSRVGVLSQTDIVLARQGRTIEEARALIVGEVMTEGVPRSRPTRSCRWRSPR